MCPILDLILISSLQEISDDLMSHLSTLMSSNLPSESSAVQQRTYVTFSCLPSTPESSDLTDRDPTVTLLERRHLISGSRTTGFRTWEAALHLGSYLLTHAGASLIKDKNIIELGAGTGFISILCAKHLRAKHVTATDGDEGVVEALKENLFFNDIDDGKDVNVSVLRWGQFLKGTWVEEECEAAPYDVVLGADIVCLDCTMEIYISLNNSQTYDKPMISALVATLRFLFGMRPALQVIIAGAVRNAETFETFRHACSKCFRLRQPCNAE